MRSRTTERKKILGFEPLEGRALLSVSGITANHQRVTALLARPNASKFGNGSPGETAILNAYFGGAGHEFIALIQKEVKNLPSVLRGFLSGAIKVYNIPGVAVKSPPTLRGPYTGTPHDSLALNVGGAVLLKAKMLELAAIVRGSFSTYPGTTEIVFAVNRGAGSKIGPAFASVPGITPDALVTVTVGPYGQSNSATLTDLTTGTTQPLSAPILVKGPTVRILLSASQLPSKGWPIQKYQFAVWAETQPNAPIEDVGSFLPDGSMIPIGVETNLNATF